MRITTLGHACVLIESDTTRILVDPGAYTASFEEERGLDAVLVTHQHADHMAVDRIPRLMAFNPSARMWAEPAAAAALVAAGLECGPLSIGEPVEVGDLVVTPVGGRHDVIHRDLPAMGNVGLLVTEGDRVFFHPGDSYAETPAGVDVLAVPLMAPWATLGNTADFVRAVAAPRWVPIHDALVSGIGRAGYLGNLGRLAAASELVDLGDGTALEV